MDMAFRYLPMKNWPDLVLGYDPWDIGLQTHQVSAEPLDGENGNSL